MFGLQPLHIVVIVVLALLIFGPSRIPEVARSLGRSVVEFQRAATSIPEEMRKAADEIPATKSEAKADSEPKPEPVKTDA